MSRHTIARQISRDAAIWLFALIALAALVVSAPATFALVALFHADGTSAGLAATIALLIILEAGTVAAKIATVYVEDGRGPLQAFTIAGLVLNAGSNLAHGLAIGTAHAGGLTLWLGALAYAVWPPALIYLMLWLICRRLAAIRGEAADVAAQVRRDLAPVARVIATHEQLQALMAALQTRPQLPAMPSEMRRNASEAGAAAAEASLPMVTGSEAVADRPCPSCGTLLDAARYGAARRYGYCQTCRPAQRVSAAD